MNKHPQGLGQIEIIDGIAYFHFSQERIGIKEAKSIVEFRKAFTKGIAYPYIISNTNMFSVKKDAFQYFSKEGIDGVIASVIIVDNSITKLLYSIYQVFHQANGKNRPLKSFRTKKDAIEWISQYKTDN